MATIPGTNGNDTLFGTQEADVINLGNGAPGNDKVNGGAGNDILYGGAGNDTLTGQAGSDIMDGGPGDDFYHVDDEDNSTEIVERAGNGFDTVLSPVNWTLGDNFEKLQLGNSNVNGTGNSLNNVLFGGSGDNILDGLDGNDTIRGYGGNDQLIGGAGNDVLDGGSGNDRMTGGIGNDQYFVDSVGDTITENAGEGTDIVSVSIDNYTMAANVENLFMLEGAAITAIGNSTAGTRNYMQGNSNNNNLTGGFGNDLINGWTGSDTMSGFIGDDSYTVDVFDDIVNEFTGQGTDTVFSYAANYTLSNNIERLVLNEAGFGFSAGVNGTANDDGVEVVGNSVANILTGGTGDDTLSGGGDSDQLLGGLGNDFLDGGDGDDSLTGSQIGSAGSEADFLRGGLGSDDFVLGAAGGSFYTGSDQYAIISDFISTTDTITLGGSAGDYTLQEASGSTRIVLNGSIGAIARIQGVDMIAIYGDSASALASIDFNFV
ncbi:MAG: calcium-binding protein [Sphaerospermopsis sp. SIO1G1]|nr:calcium-binding protein [Sphaerospermopsis sp. SIO1G1]